MGADLFYDDGRTEMTGPIVAFLNFTKALKKMKNLRHYPKKN